MSTEMSRMVQKALAEEGNRGLGNVELTSDRTLAQYSIAGQQGADNLVDKAFRALEGGDRDRADRYLHTAARLPFDDREHSHPLAWTVHVKLFSLVSDTIEDSDERDSRWLDVAIDLLTRSGETARTELRDTLASIDQDYRLGRKERRVLRAAIAEVPSHPPLPDQRLSEDQLAASALAVLDLCRAYHLATAQDTD